MFNFFPHPRQPTAKRTKCERSLLTCTPTGSLCSECPGSEPFIDEIMTELQMCAVN